MYSNITVEIEGRVGNAPEVVAKKDGSSFVKLNVAVNKKIKDKQTGQEVSKAIWFVVNLNGWQADYAKNHVEKGSAVFVTGALDFQDWTDKNGVNHTSNQIQADRLRLLVVKKLANGESEFIVSKEVDYSLGF